MILVEMQIQSCIGPASVNDLFAIILMYGVVNEVTSDIITFF
jgi:hypothetical protein